MLITLDASLKPDMNLEFTLHGVEISKNELTAILETTGQKPAITIEVERYLKTNSFQIEKLFALSIEKGNPELASLAAKLAIKGINDRPKRTYKKMVRLTDTPVDNIDIEKAIETMATSESLRHTGAATILLTLSKSYESKLTLRQIALNAVNTLAFRGNVSPDSACFRGFRKDVQGNYRVVVQDAGIERSDCYHASPMYTALREGSQLLRQWQLIDVEQTIAFGSEEKELDENSKQLRRTVYKVSLTDKARELLAKWGDLDSYVDYRWSQRVRTKQELASA